MIDFSNKTYQNILSDMLARVPNIIDKRETSIIQTSLGPAGWYIEQIYLDLEQIQNNSFILTANGDALDRLAYLRGILRLEATAATRLVRFNVQVPLQSRFRTINGSSSVTFFVQAYQGTHIENDVTYYDYYAVCETKGTIGNEYTGNILPIDFIQNLNYSVILDIIIPGTDEETDESLRNRYILSLTEKGFGGNIASYREAILEQNTIGAVQVYPADYYNGPGTVLCSIIDANYNVATASLIEEIQNLICPPEANDTTPSANGYGIAPIGAKVTIGTATELPINITATITPSGGSTVQSLQDAIESAINDYLLTVRRDWGLPVTNKVEYPVYVYIARINVAILSVEGVANVTNITVNGGTTDIDCTETGQLQELPVLGTVTLNNA